MNSLMEHHFATFFLLFFAFLWLMVTTILGVLSGWWRLQSQFPNQEGEPLLRIARCSGTMGWGVNLNGILTLSVCYSGLRVGIMRVFGPFCREFLVPWDSITVTRKRFLFWQMANLQFGNPLVGTLRIRAHVADKLARAAIGHWPEIGPFPEESKRKAFRRRATEWAVLTYIAALFFTLVPMALTPKGSRPPIAVAILFPAIGIGVFMIVRFLSEKD